MKTVCRILFSVLALPVLAVESLYLPRNIRVDGRLSEEVWARAPKITSFTCPDKAVVERRTEAQIIFTPKAIVFGFKAYIPKAKLYVFNTDIQVV